jgi:hypothetical protein
MQLDFFVDGKGVMVVTRIELQLNEPVSVRETSDRYGPLFPVGEGSDQIDLSGFREESVEIGRNGLLNERGVQVRVLIAAEASKSGGARRCLGAPSVVRGRPGNMILRRRIVG